MAILTGKAKEESDARWAKLMERARRAFNRRILEKRIEEGCDAEDGLYACHLLRCGEPLPKDTPLPWASFRFVDESSVYLYTGGCFGWLHSVDMGRVGKSMAQRWAESPEGQAEIRETFATYGEVFARYGKEIAHAEK